MIKIVSGHSYPVGSTVALANLCNQLNSRGYASIFYGPDNWHIDKCASGTLENFKPGSGDIIILHDIELWSVAELSALGSTAPGTGQNCSWRAWARRVLGCLAPASPPEQFKLVLTCQKDDACREMTVRHALFHKIHFISEAQKSFRATKYPKFVCPNFTAELPPSNSKPEKTAGVIGTISQENGTEAAIVKALQEGMDTVILYGYLADPIYYYSKIEPLIRAHPGKIKFAGFVDDQQKMYDSVSDVYTGRASCSVRRECAMTHTRYHGPEVDADVNMTNDQIFEVWKKELGL